jgi:hypothetical protein
MDTIGTDSLWSFLGRGRRSAKVTCTKVREDPGFLVPSYLELARCVAELQFRNRQHVLLFRGQGADHKNQHGRTTLKPTLFRADARGNPSEPLLRRRFEALRWAEERLIHLYAGGRFLGKERVARQQIVRWSILQHYGVCPTPLLDVTHSLRIAASFASHDGAGEAFLYVLGVPSLGGAISASSEASLQTVRLASVCPPAALRPHVQEGYLLGEYPDIAELHQKQRYEPYEVDFGRRLIAKFRFSPKGFWRRDGFPVVGKEWLYPTAAEDPLLAVAERIREELRRALPEPAAPPRGGR